jgi:hypothetical protein
MLTSNTTVATTILAQLGGRRFVMMTGARQLVAAENFLQFRLPKRGIDGSNRWRITLTPMDTYTVETFWVRMGNVELKSTFTDIYCDQLVELFEKTSGFYTTL